MKFREFKTSLGSEILLGKSAANNDELVKEFEGKKNIILHTAKPGSPFGVLVDSKDKKDVYESSIAIALKSQDWRDNKGDVVVHQFTGKQVYKSKEMKVGTWGIKGKPKSIKIKKEDIIKI